MDNRRQLLAHLGTGTAVALLSRSVRGDAGVGDGKPIRIGQIGVGHGHATKLSVYRESSDYEVVGVVEPDAELRKRAESQAVFRDLPWMTQEQLLNQTDLQAVLVETHVRDSLDAAEACVAAGKHVHLDKPAGQSLPQFQRILDEAARRQLMVQMGYMYRYNPAVVLLRKYLRDGWLGDIFELHAVMSKVVAPEERRRLAGYPGGMMFELGCHLLDIVITILGRPSDVTGFAKHAAEADDSLLDNTLAVLSYPRALATVKSTAMEVQGGDRRHLVVCGTEGTFHIQPLDNPSVRLTLAKPRGGFRAGTHEIAMPRYVRYVDDAVDMARVIRGEKPTDFPYHHDLEVQRTLLRACRLPLAP